MKTQRNLLLIAALFIAGSCNKMDEPGRMVPKTADQDSEVPAIKIADRLLHSEAFGEPNNTIVVCLHGGPGADYRYMLPAKSLVNYGYRVVFYDQVGSGLSQRFNENYYDKKNIDEIYLNELKGVIDHYKTSNDQKVILLGHSWGAIMATAYAARYPEKIHGMVLIEPGGLKWDDIIAYIKKSQSTPLWSEISNDALYQDQFISNKKDNHEILDFKLALFASHGNPNTEENTILKEGFWRYGSVINLISFNYGQKDKPDLGDGIQNYNRPILFMHGAKKNVYTDAWAQKISANFKFKEVFKVPGVGHSGMFDPMPWSTITLPKIVSYFNML